jgi:hypothetical protein
MGTTLFFGFGGMVECCFDEADAKMMDVIRRGVSRRVDV